MTESTRFLTSAQAAARLGVKPATLYAYVSRGLVRSTKSPDGRTSLFDPADLGRLERRSTRRRGSPADVVMASELTLIDTDAGRLYYRGLDPLDACLHRRFEEIAGWLWTGNFDGAASWRADERSKRAGERAQQGLPQETAASDRIAITAAALAALHSRRSPSEQATDAMSCLVDCLPGAATRAGSTFASRLFAKLSERDPSPALVKALDAALSLTADHGATYSALVARVVAAGGGDIASAISGALAAAIPSVRTSCFTELEHAFALASEVGASRAARELRPDAVSAAALREPYPSGDPRARTLLEILAAAAPDEAPLVREMTEEVRARGGGPPTAVFAQAALSWACGMRAGSGEVISLVSRAAGWIAHALEEYRRPTPFRPRLAYTGPAPRSTPIRTLDAVVSYLSRE